MTTGTISIIEQLTDQPKVIREARIEAAARSQAHDRAVEELRSNKATLMQTVTSKVDPTTGKPEFTNDAARHAAVEAGQSPMLVAAVDQSHQASVEASITLQYEQDVFSSLRAIARLADSGD